MRRFTYTRTVFGVLDGATRVRKSHGVKPDQSGISRFNEQFAHAVTKRAGSSGAFALACSLIVLWLLLGPVFHFSDTWQLVINTGTTIITFLMVFLIQRSQNKDSLALHLKLNELVAAMDGASNRLVNIEDITEEELHLLHQHYQTLADLAKGEGSIRESHSIDEAEKRSKAKHEANDA